MSNLPTNLVTAVICEKKGEDVNTLSVLFKVAYRFAQKGSIIYILTKPTTDIPISKDGNFLQPTILERIHFRYFSTSEEIIQWCHQAHHLQTKPPVLLISMKDFSNSNNFESLSLCAALLDALIHFCKVLNTKQIYFLALMIIDFNSFIPNLLSFFKVSWLASMKYGSLQLIPFQMKENESALKIRLNDDLSFDDVKQIFLFNS